MKTAKMFLFATVFASSTANAAVLQDVQGDVRVGRDKGFEKVLGSTELLPGDKIKVGRKASARLVYPDGCNVPVEPGSLSRVAEHSPCSFKAQVGDNNSPVFLAGGGNDWWPAALILAGLGAAAGGAVASEGGYNAQPVFFPLPGRPPSP